MRSPVIYYAVRKSRVEREKMPPEVFSLCQTERCACCKEEVLVGKAAIKKAMLIAKERQSQVVIACHECVDKAAPREEFMATVDVRDAELGKAIAKHNAEKN